MKEIAIPVSRLTRATLLHRYTSEPIRLANNDIRRRELMHVGTTNRHLERKQYSLNTSVRLLVNRHEYDHLLGREAEVGYFLYAMDKERIFQFVWARVTAGLPALHAIQDYYRLNGIEEDDFALETSERLWKRWRTEKEKNRNTETPRAVPSACCVLFSERQAKSIIERLHSFIDEQCIVMDSRYREAVAAWVYCDLTTLTVRETAEKVGRRKGNTGTSVRRFREYLRYNEELRTYVAYVIKTTQARPTPSAAS